VALLRMAARARTRRRFPFSSHPGW
jgi:hypothetical protein